MRVADDPGGVDDERRAPVQVEQSDDAEGSSSDSNGNAKPSWAAAKARCDSGDCGEMASTDASRRSNSPIVLVYSLSCAVQTGESSAG